MTTLGNFYKPLATIILPKSATFLANFCKGVKIYHFWATFIDNWRFFSGHTDHHHHHSLLQCINDEAFFDVQKIVEMIAHILYYFSFTIFYYWHVVLTMLIITIYKHLEKYLS